MVAVLIKDPHAAASFRAEAAGPTQDQPDLVLVGAVMSVLNTNQITHDKNHKSKERQWIYSHYLFCGQYICCHTFQFLLGVRKDWLQAIKASYMEKFNNTHTWKHKNTSSQCDILWSNIENVTFVTNFAEEQAILLLGWIPGYKKDDFKLLPSSTTKKIKCTIGIQVQNV